MKKESVKFCFWEANKTDVLVLHYTVFKEDFRVRTRRASTADIFFRCDAHGHVLYSLSL